MQLVVRKALSTVFLVGVRKVVPHVHLLVCHAVDDGVALADV